VTDFVMWEAEPEFQIMLKTWYTFLKMKINTNVYGLGIIHKSADDFFGLTPHQHLTSNKNNLVYILNSKMVAIFSSKN